ncbi:Response regulator receiver domain-containing protein [Kaistia soli DSM 19436]|uniref:Response regulator receiver domain-containing protein n=1 Tax=Kaistia soli DSM 19436 TaxID=1122133 RepID=A0A1M5L6K5_9HYPH|nr:response regulator [Kaistia soli]SHG60658.1 Response regulator receiver domain-containing protein [Kaistia soli DSM 19436]
MTGGKKSIAVVDDDQRILESIEDLLEAVGHSVQLFASAEALIEADAVDGLDCLITDIGLPAIDGIELCRIVRTSCPDLPVIFITGRYETADQTRASRSNHQGYFRKPFDATALLAAVSQALSTPGGHHHDG